MTSENKWPLVSTVSTPMWMGLLLILAIHQSIYAQSRTWKSTAGTTMEAELVEVNQSAVKLRTAGGREIVVPVIKLSPNDQMYLARRARGNSAGTPLAATKPSGKERIDRSLRWEDVEGDVPEPKHIKDLERRALTGFEFRVGQTPHFYIHYDSKIFGQRMARMAEFFYTYIGRDLKGLEDRYGQRSHIYCFDNPGDYKRFVANAGGASWSAAYVRGDMMFMPDFGDTERSTAVLGHEMTHLVLNRHFKHRPPRWLNEGVAEWYESFARPAFKGTYRGKKSVFSRPPIYTMPLNQLERTLPGSSASVTPFYQTSKYLIGYMRLKDEEGFQKYLNEIVNDGVRPSTALKTHFGVSSIGELQVDFDTFAKR